jgi:hypothetical protein
MNSGMLTTCHQQRIRDRISAIPVAERAALNAEPAFMWVFFGMYMKYVERSPNMASTFEAKILQRQKRWLQEHSGAIPQMSSSVPQGSSSVPQMSSSVPQGSSSVPHVSSSIPSVSTTVLHVSSGVPQVSSAVPRVSPAVPHVSPAVPRVSPAVPHVSSAVPRVSPAVPPVSPAVPPVSPAVPQGSAVIPHTAATSHLPRMIRAGFHNAVPGPSRKSPVLAETRLRPRPPQGHRRLGDIEMEESDGDNSTSDAEEAPKARDKKGKGKAKEDLDDYDSMTDGDEAPKVRDKKGKGKMKESSEPHSGRKLLAVSTGRLHNDPCSECTKRGLQCFINLSGGSCVPCRFSKKRCDKAHPRKTTKKMTGKFIESDGEEGTGPDAHPNDPKPARRVRHDRKVPGKNVFIFLRLILIVSLAEPNTETDVGTAGPLRKPRKRARVNSE